MVHDLPHEIPVNATQSIETQKLMTLATILIKKRDSTNLIRWQCTKGFLNCASEILIFLNRRISNIQTGS